MHKTILFDQLTPVALYGKIKELFPNEITMLFESMVNTSDGNLSFIVVGAQERLSYKNKTTSYTDLSGTTKELQEDPFSFLKSYYAKVDKNFPYEEIKIKSPIMHKNNLKMIVIKSKLDERK